MRRYKGRKVNWDMKPDGYLWNHVQPGDTIRWNEWGSEAIAGSDLVQPFTLIPYSSGSDYSGNLVERSNYQALLDSHSDELIDISGGHGTFGVGFLGSVHNLSEDLQDAIASLHDYPLLDESLHSEMELEHVHEQWADHGLPDFRKQLERDFLPSIGFEMTDERVDILDELESTQRNSDADLSTFWYENTENMDGYGGGVNEGDSGSSIYFDHDRWFETLKGAALVHWLNSAFGTSYMVPIGDTATVLADAIHDWFTPFADGSFSLAA